MKVGILGTDSRALAIGRLFAGAGHEVSFAALPGGEDAQRAATQIGAKVQSPYAEAATCNLLVFANRRADLDRLLKQIGRIPHETVVLDVMEGASPAAASGAEFLARKLDSHRVVRGLVILPMPGADVPLCGDDADALSLVEELFRSCGCVTIERGPLANAKEIEPPETIVGDTPFENLKDLNQAPGRNN